MTPNHLETHVCREECFHLMGYKTRLIPPTNRGIHPGRMAISGRLTKHASSSTSALLIWIRLAHFPAVLPWESVFRGCVLLLQLCDGLTLSFKAVVMIVISMFLALLWIDPRAVWVDLTCCSVSVNNLNGRAGIDGFSRTATCYLSAKETRWHDLETRCCVCVTFSQHEQMLRRLIHETTTLWNGLIWILGIKDVFFVFFYCKSSLTYFTPHKKKNLDILWLVC